MKLSELIIIVTVCGFIGVILLLALIYIIHRHIKYRKNLDARNNWKLQHRKSLKGNFIVTHTSPINDTYSIDPEAILGKGSFGIVVVGVHHDSNLEYAIKIVNKSTGKSGRIERELKLLKDVDHPNIVRLFAAYDTADQVRIFIFIMFICNLVLL